MRVRFDAGREPDDEIAEVRWVPLSDAPGALSYKHDRGVVAAFAKLPRIIAEVWLIRHARAGTQHAWHGPDRLRPLDAVGHEQVARLTGALSAVPPDRLVSATPLRCRETLASLAELLGLPVKVDGAFGAAGVAAVAVAVAVRRVGVAAARVVLAAVLRAGALVAVDLAARVVLAAVVLVALAAVVLVALAAVVLVALAAVVFFAAE